MHRPTLLASEDSVVLGAGLCKDHRRSEVGLAAAIHAFI